MENRSLLGPLIDDLIRRASDPGEIQVCPYCKGELHVSIRIHIDAGSTVYIDGNPVNVGWGKYLGTGANCRKCNAAFFVQYGAEAIPAWAKESECKDRSVEELWRLLRKDSESN
jgi:hypothetical protein